MPRKKRPPVRLVRGMIYHTPCLGIRLRLPFWARASAAPEAPRVQALRHSLSGIPDCATIPFIVLGWIAAFLPWNGTHTCRARRTIVAV